MIGPVLCAIFGHNREKRPIVDSDTDQWKRVRMNFPKYAPLIEGLDHIHYCPRCSDVLEISNKDIQ